VLGQFLEEPRHSASTKVEEAHPASGVAFALGGWNPRAVPEPGDLVLATPADALTATE